MKQLLTLMIFLGSWFLINAQTTQPVSPIRVQPIEDDTENYPQTPVTYHIYYILTDKYVTVYSMEPLCGEVIANDAMSGEPLCDVTTYLADSYSFYIGSPRVVNLYVLVDSRIYFCQINSN